MFVGKQDGLAYLCGLVQVLSLVGFQKVNVAHEKRVSGVDIAVDLRLDAAAQFFSAVDVNLCSLLLSLVFIEDSQRDSDAGSDRVQGVRIVERAVMGEPESHGG